MEEGHQISYKLHFGYISREHYDFLFGEFYELLKNRFAEKKMYNKNLIKWKYYYELVYPMILIKNASLFVIYDNEKPITITLNFHLKDMVFSFMETYDVAYSKFNMGDISMFKHLEWCLNNQVEVFDLSMGETGKKIKWCNHRYDFEFHIFFNHEFVSSRLSALLISYKLRIKQYLRDKQIIGKMFQLDKFLYKRKTKKLGDYNWRD